MGSTKKVAIRPLDDRVVVEIVEAEEKTKGGIVLPDNAKEKPQEGIVLAIGPGKLGDDGKRHAMTVKNGDKVIFGKYAGNDVTVDGEELKILRESDILAQLA